MIDAVEPLSMVLWGVFFLAAGMYPIGFMLGAPCSPCCKSQCDDVVEFNRCIRFVNTDTSSPPTNTTTEPLHGFSRAVTRPEQVGAIRVATKLEASGGVSLSNFAATMSAGETTTATYRFYFSMSPVGYQSDIGTAFEWNVTLQGVTRPLSPPAVLESRQYLASAGSSNTPEYLVGDSRISQSAAVSAWVHSCTVVSGSQWLDGASVSESTLRSMLSVYAVTRSSSLVAGGVFTPTPSVFAYVPQGQQVVLRYVIEHSRGSTRRYSTQEIAVFKDTPSQPLPAGGLSSLAIPTAPYVDTPYGVTPPEFSGSNATIYSDNAIWNYEFQGVTIPFPAVEITPSGQQLRAAGIFMQATNGQHLVPLFASNAYNQAQTTTTARGWIMRAFDVGGGYTFDGNRHPSQNQWNYNVAEVESFLNGDSTVPYDSGSTSDPIRPLYGPPPSTSWTMQVSEPVKFCGFSLCGQAAINLASVYSDAIAKSVRLNTPPYPSQYQTTTETGTQTIQMPCQHPPVEMTLRLSMGPHSSNCAYSGEFSTCQNPSSNNAFWTRVRSMPVRAFYCGDLLWAIENGPCRNSLSFPLLNWGTETYTLDGDASTEWRNHSKCHVFRDQNDGACIPLEATASLDDIEVIGLAYDAIDEPPSIQSLGNLSGDCVFSAVSARSTAFLCGPVDFNVPVLPTNCVRQVFGGQVQVPQYGMLALTLFRTRSHWCTTWGNGEVRPSFCGAFLRATTPNQPPPECTFGEPQPLLPKDTASAPSSVIPASGGRVNVAYCCPDRIEQVTIPENPHAFSRQWLIETNNTVGRGKTAYVTQYGYRDGDGQCRTSVVWLAGSTGYPFYAGNPARIFSSSSCPIVGQVSHAEQPSCEWSVESGTDWLVVEKTQEGLLSVSINASVTPIFTGSGEFGDYVVKAFRAGTITINSGGTTAVWSIIQIQP